MNAKTAAREIARDAAAQAAAAPAWIPVGNLAPAVSSWLQSCGRLLEWQQQAEAAHGDAVRAFAETLKSAATSAQRAATWSDFSAVAADLTHATIEHERVRQSDLFGALAGLQVELMKGVQEQIVGLGRLCASLPAVDVDGASASADPAAFYETTRRSAQSWVQHWAAMMQPRPVSIS